MPPGISNLSNLISLVLRNFNLQGFKKNSLFILVSHFCLLKLEEEFPSCFQNMTKLTKLVLYNMRGSNPEPIPFPTLFCNMICLQKFSSIGNNFSGFRER